MSSAETERYIKTIETQWGLLVYQELVTPKWRRFRRWHLRRKQNTQWLMLNYVIQEDLGHHISGVVRFDGAE